MEFTPPWELVRCTPWGRSFWTRPPGRWIREPWTRPSWSLNRRPLPPFRKSLRPKAPNVPLSGRRISAMIQDYDHPLPKQLRSECWLSTIVGATMMMSHAKYDYRFEIYGHELLNKFEEKRSKDELENLPLKEQKERGHGGLLMDIGKPLSHARDYGFRIAGHAWRYFPIRGVIDHSHRRHDRDFIRSRLDAVGMLIVSFPMKKPIDAEAMERFFDDVELGDVIDATSSELLLGHTAILCGYDESEDDVWFVRHAALDGFEGYGRNGLMRMKLNLEEVFELKWAKPKRHVLFKAGRKFIRGAKGGITRLEKVTDELVLDGNDIELVS